MRTKHRIEEVLEIENCNEFVVKKVRRKKRTKRLIILNTPTNEGSSYISILTITQKKRHCTVFLHKLRET